MGLIFTFRGSGFDIEQHIGKVKQLYIAIITGLCLTKFGVIQSPNSEK